MKIWPIGYNTGITPLVLTADKLIVGFDFGHFNKDSPEAITFRGIVYERGMLEIVRHTDYAEYCSVRGYTPLKVEVK